MPIDVSIIIVNYKSEQDLEKCLKSLYRCTEGVSFEIFIYNNDSNKDTLEALISSYNNCNLIQSFSNVGFAKACNLAASKASGKYLFFLNPDTYLENNALGYFIDFFENNSNNKTACLGAYMNNTQAQAQHSFGYFPIMSIVIIKKLKSLTRHLIFKRHLNKNDTSFEFNKVQPVAYVTGADLFMPHKIFKQVNGFDERFFMYFEECDLQKRLTDLGFQNFIIPGPKIVHSKGASFKDQSALMRVYYLESFLKYLKKHEPSYKYYPFLAIWFLLDLKTFFQKFNLLNQKENVVTR